MDFTTAMVSTAFALCQTHKEPGITALRAISTHSTELREHLHVFLLGQATMDRWSFPTPITSHTPMALPTNRWAQRAMPGLSRVAILRSRRWQHCVARRLTSYVCASS